MALFPSVEGIITFAFYPYGFERASRAISTPFESGHKAVRPRHTEQVRRGQLTCRNLPKLSKERISAFFREIRGGGNIFQIINRVDAIVPPYFARDLSETGGGSLGSRTYYVVVTHANPLNTKETTECLEDSFLVAANKWLTVKSPDFPPGVSRANIYIGAAPGVVYYSGRSIVPLELWTESDAATTVNGDSGVGTDILFVVATTGMKIGDVIRVHDGGARQEDLIIKDLLSGPVRIQTETNLQFTHTLVQADPVKTKVGLSTQATPPTDNNFFDEQINVALAEGSEWKPVLTSAGVWEATMDLEEQLP
jgi:hypothetical protein